jgi:hypothetical protein
VEFSRPSIAERRQAGLRDVTRAIEQAPWFKHRKPAHLKAVVHKVHDGAVTTRPTANLRTTDGNAGGGKAEADEREAVLHAP